jgi:hypothetical protein
MQNVQTRPLSASEVIKSDVSIIKAVWAIGAAIGTTFVGLVGVIYALSPML